MINASKNHRDTSNRVNAIADTWAEIVIMKWQNLNLFHPDIVAQAEQFGRGTLTMGTFAAALYGSVSLAGRAIVLKNGTITSMPLEEGCSDGPCAFGMTDIFIEFEVIRTSDRAREDAKRPLDVPDGMSREMAHIIRRVDLTIMLDPSKKVGGPVDAAILHGDGRIEWVQRKPNCPAIRII
jgi:hypothetical protein